MGGKKAAAKGGASKEADAEKIALGINDIDDETYKKTVRIECRKIEANIKQEEQMTAMYNDERLRMNYFWLISKKELEDK